MPDTPPGRTVAAAVAPLPASSVTLGAVVYPAPLESIRTAVTWPGVSTRPCDAETVSWSATDTLADDSMITLPLLDVSERSLSVPSTATVPVSRTLPRSDDTVPEPFLSRSASRTTPEEPDSVAAPRPLFVTASMARMPPAVIEIGPAVEVADSTRRSSESVIEIPVPAVAEIVSALEFSVIRPLAVTVMLSASRRAWLVMSVAAVMSIAPPGADTTAAESTDTAPLRLVTETLPMPLWPAVTKPPRVTVSPASWMLPARVVSGLLTTRLLASSNSPASVRMSELMRICAPVALALRAIWPRELGTAAILRLPACWSIEMPMSGLTSAPLTTVLEPTLTLVTEKFLVLTSIWPPSMPALNRVRLPPPDSMPDGPVTMFVACVAELVCSVTLPAVTVPSMRTSPPTPLKPTPVPCWPMNTPRSASMTAPASRWKSPSEIRDVTLPVVMVLRNSMPSRARKKFSPLSVKGAARVI